ncbi:MAG: hypothetical protein Kow0026_20290 [Oricola sp.]
MGIFARITERMDRQSHLMGAMMACLDVDTEGAATEAGGARLERAARSCLMCPDSDKCERWLASHPHAEAGPDFCPNRMFFAMHRG